MPPKPKKKCCVTKPRCKRCPLRLMAAGKLPDGFTVKKRKLVKADDLVMANATGAAKAEKGKKGKGKKGKKLPAAA